MLHGGERSLAEIWVMKEYKVHSSWTKTFVVSFGDIPTHRDSFRCGLQKVVILLEETCNLD